MKNRFHTYITALLLSALALTGCSHDDVAEEETRSNGSQLKLRITVSAPAGHTRATANPTGGEHGDGWRIGRYNENNIYDVYLYKFSSSQGINAPDDTPVTLLAFEKYVNFRPEPEDADVNGIISKELTFNVGSYLYEAGNNDHFIAAINTDILGVNTTLGRLRNELIGHTCRQMGDQMKHYDRFTMANARDSHFEGGSGTEADPYVVSIDVERTAARLDFAYSEAAQAAGKFRIQDGKYIYKVAGTDDELHLTHVRATNVNQAAPYLIKRLAASAGETPVYLADETNQASKYVVEPTTWTKTKDAAAANSLNTNYWFRDSWYLTAHDNYKTTWFRDQDKVHVGGNDTNEHNAFTDGTTIDEKDHDWQYYVLSYANENTMLADETHQDYTTGLILKGTYVPHEVYSDANATTGVCTVDATYTAGTTFWRCHLVDTNEDLYFSNVAAANAYKIFHPLSVVYPYENGQCYYNVWLRHENVIDDPTTTMMEFGIVRNNIYRVCVEFSGIGMPDIPEDMVTPETVRMYIYVRKWNLIEHPVIEL